MQTGEHPTTDPQRRPPPCPRAFTPTPPPFPTDGGTCTTTCARRAHSAEAGGGAAGLGFSEAVAQTANRRRGDGSAKIKGALRDELASAVRRERAVAEAEARGERAYPDHVYESIEVTDERTLPLLLPCDLGALPFDSLPACARCSSPLAPHSPTRPPLCR